MNNSPFVCVLILNYNGKHLLKEALESYLANDYPNYKVVVVDNGSTDQSDEFVKANYPEVYVHRTVKNLKYSGGLNFGMEYAFNKLNADYVLITNNDVKAAPDLITALVETSERDKDIAFTIGKVYYYDQPDVLQTVGKKFHPTLWNGGHIGNGERDTGQYDKVEERYWCDDIYWLVKREVWEKTGGYDTEFAFQGEDFDWQVRAKQLGYKIMYTPKARLWHKESMTIGKASPFKAYYDARNPLIIHMKYRTRKEFMPVLKQRFTILLKSTPKMIAKGRLMVALKSWQGFSSALAWGYRNGLLP